MQWVLDSIGVLAAAAIVRGFWLVHPSLAWIVGGLLVLAGAMLMSRRADAGKAEAE